MIIRKAILIGMLGLVVGLIIFPVMAVTCLFTYCFDKKGVIPGHFSTLISWVLIRSVPGWTLKVEGKENIVKGKSYVVIANHCTLVDIFLLHFVPVNYRWVAKREVLMVPVFGWVLALQRSITIKRGDPASAKYMLSEGVRLLKKGVSVAIFPEGTRSKTGLVQEFKAGAFLMAANADVEILPVILHGSHQALRVGGKVDFRVEILPPVSMEGRKTSVVMKELNAMYIDRMNS